MPLTPWRTRNRGRTSATAVPPSSPYNTSIIFLTWIFPASSASLGAKFPVQFVHGPHGADLGPAPDWRRGQAKERHIAAKAATTKLG
jgi:hypothetical protein